MVTKVCRSTLLRPTARVLVYCLVVIAIILVRGHFRSPRTELRELIPVGRDTVRTVVLVGVDMAPQLIPKLVARYKYDQPGTDIRVGVGGTAQGLEDLANRKATVAMLYRLPTEREASIFYSAAGDSVACDPIALGGILLLVRRDSPVESLAPDDLRTFLAGRSHPRFEHLYAPDPNQGLWDALRTSLGLPREDDTPESEAIVFLRDPAAVIQAVAADPGGLGLASTLNVPDNLDSLAIRAVPVAPNPAAPPVAPGYEAIGYGEYPLHHYLYVAYRPYGNVPGSMFVTYLTSDLGQRAIERLGFLPARLTLREIYLTRKPVGSP